MDNNMEKYNWFQNNMGSYIIVHNDGATETYIASAGNAEKAHFITTACNAYKEPESIKHIKLKTNYEKY